ncbi:MAG: hypothetical protein ACR2KS_10265 [Candidatus Eremiobacter antarcticus]|nr:hypothetical protein [Candidatus Eremiobacteraeota bacterium]MBC5808817.1 hypothetical protein [Candidatus Eremiobacteraeota bacterium]
MTHDIIPARLKRFESVRLRKGAGAGGNGEVDVCLMQAVDWLTGGTGQTDAPTCVAQTITRYCVGLNDSLLFSQQQHRDLLKPYAIKMIGTRTGVTDERQRAFIAADYAVRVFGPIWLHALGYQAWAKRLESVAPITDSKSSTAARDAAREVRAAAAAYAAASYNAADASDAATAASDADASYADASYAAASYAAAADAAAAASYAAASYAAADASYAAAAYATAASDADAAYAAASYAAAAVSGIAARSVHAHARGDELRAKALACLDAMIAVGRLADTEPQG